MKLRQRKAVLDDHKQGLRTDVRAPSKIREGLPEWVNYIPAKWYSSTIRQVFEYILVLYTLLTLSWAVWQLYKHVGFIQSILKPVLKIIEKYVQVLRDWFRWLDGLFDVFTGWWWRYLKPVLMLATPLYTALAALFKPLRNVADVIAMVTTPLLSCVQVVATALRPLARPLVMFWHLILQLYGRLSVSLGILWGMVSQWPIVRILVEKVQELGLQNLIHELSNSNLDPLKAQMMVIQNILVRSFKQVFYGLKFVWLRIVYMTVFFRRERDYAREETATEMNARVEKQKNE